MIYFTIQLDGRVTVYDMTESRFLLRARLEADAEALPHPANLAQAHDYARASCHQFELFDEIEEATAWADRYEGFRAGEVRAALRRFQTRRAEAFLAAQSNNTTTRQTDERAVRYG